MPYNKHHVVFLQKRKTMSSFFSIPKFSQLVLLFSVFITLMLCMPVAVMLHEQNIVSIAFFTQSINYFFQPLHLAPNIHQQIHDTFCTLTQQGHFFPPYFPWFHPIGLESPLHWISRTLHHGIGDRHFFRHWKPSLPCWFLCLFYFPFSSGQISYFWNWRGFPNYWSCCQTRLRKHSHTSTSTN